mmetsp:Transcript_34174/g.49669  ORF Transcript_34174/g.49669 Transcript_34174/m.49669 type:complete len:148 (+) Transcript_34174:27-470(+)
MLRTTLIIAVVLSICLAVQCFTLRSYVKQASSISSTSLFAHHPQKKIIKRKMDRRPKKHRESDITRSNVNLNKCITKFASSLPEYTIISAEEYMKVREQALKFWEDGDSAAEWLEITEEDMVATFSENREPVPGVQKRPNLVKSGSC